jgi:hypothetical protein
MQFSPPAREAGVTVLTLGVMPEEDGFTRMLPYRGQGGWLRDAA